MSWSAQPVALTVVSSGPWQGHRIALPVGTHTIGRAPAGGIVIADGTLSREHARLHHDGTRVTVVDLGSRNGTRVNDYRIVGAHELRDGDLVQLGAVDLRFEGPRRDEAAGRDGPERRRRSPVAMMLVFGVVATFLGLAVDAAFDFLRKDWSNPFGIGMVATLTFASAMIPVLQQAGSGGSGGSGGRAARRRDRRTAPGSPSPCSSCSSCAPAAPAGRPGSSSTPAATSPGTRSGPTCSSRRRPRPPVRSP